MVAGVTMSMRVSGGEGGGVSRRYRIAGSAKPAATSTATAATSQASRELRLGAAAGIAAAGSFTASSIVDAHIADVAQTIPRFLNEAAAAADPEAVAALPQAARSSPAPSS